MRRLTPLESDISCDDAFDDSPRPLVAQNAWDDDLPGVAGCITPPSADGQLAGTEVAALSSAALARLERQLMNMQSNFQNIIQQLRDDKSSIQQNTNRKPPAPSSPVRVPPKVQVEASELHIVPVETKETERQTSTTTARTSVPGARRMNALPDVEYMKAKVREAVMKPPYSVCELYKSEGPCQYIARSAWFENITLLVIALNAIWMSIEIDYNKAVVLSDSELHFQIIENLFCAYFFGEILLRFGAFHRKRDCMRDCWFVFDACLALLMISETWILTLSVSAFGVSKDIMLSGQSGAFKSIKLLRLLRTGRMIRLVRAMPELMVLIKGIAIALRSMFLTLGLMLVVSYVFSILCVQLADETDVEHLFPSMPKTLSFLLLNAALPDHADTLNDLFDISPLFAWLFLAFTLLSFVTIMNMLVGILVEVVTCVAAVEKEQLKLTYVKETLEDMLQAVGVDTNMDGLVNKDDFKSLMLNPKAVRTLRGLGIDVVGLVEVVDSIYVEDVDGLTFSEFMDLVLHLRGNNTATVKDVVDLRKFLHLQISQMLEVQKHMLSSIKRGAA
eukprot:TRINITY_DN6896_c0_g3_i1.p1 TRINITY_DN6896_c0_g3~~TRINITY_DN6896_c0_g3_i1.p1  ORF type:complete len:561 (-),score=75.84 TRINITY_DN6896_c0_g3_i1:161-1843(-)